MSTMRRWAYAVFGVACTHLVFGAIVRISGSGMGCGPHWPKCYGAWFPPMSRPDLVIEVTHRYLASILLLSLVALTVAANRRRDQAGIGGSGGVLRMAALATALGFSAALLGAVTVKLGNSAPATVAHWTVAMSLVAAVTATVIRSGGLGGATAMLGGAAARTTRSTLAAAAMALIAVVMGGLTAKVQGGPIACLSFPLCGANPDVARAAVHVQSTHRVIAVLLVLHLIGVFFALRKRRELPVLRRAAGVALGLGVLQILIAGAMIGMRLPPVLRSLHEATGVSIWIATFALACLARIASRHPDAEVPRVAAPVPPPASPPEPDIRDAGAIRVANTARPVLSSAPAPTAALVPASERHLHAPPVVESASTSDTRRTPTTPTVIAPAFATAYQPMIAAPVATSAVVPPVQPVAGGEAPRVAIDEIELRAAIQHALPIMAGAALDFHDVSSKAALGAATLEREVAQAAELALEPSEPTLAIAVADVSEVDYADMVDVEMLEVVRDAGVEAVVDALLAETVVEAFAPQTVVEVVPAAAVAEAVSAAMVVEVLVAEAVAEVALAEAVAQVVVVDALVEVVPAEMVAQAVVTETVAEVVLVEPVAETVAESKAGAAATPESSRGAPPETESTADVFEGVDQTIARRTIFDDAADTAESVDDVDDLYTLRDLDERESAEEPEHVPSLDEEFSLLATAFDEGADVIVETAITAAAATVVATRRASLAELFAMRRPLMSHSIAVIAARGSDL